MSKLALYAAIGGTGTLAAAAVLVATGVIDLDKLLGRKAAPVKAALVAPEVDTPSQPAAPSAPDAALKADPAQLPAAKPDQSEEAVLQPPQDKPFETPQPVPDQPLAEPQSAPEPAVQTAEPPKAAAALGPRFDLVRAEPGGSTLVAGTGTPGATLEVMVDGDAMANTQIGPDGRFVVFLDLVASDQSHVLRLLQKLGAEELTSDEEVIIAPVSVVATAKPKPRDEQVAALDPGKPGLTETEPAAPETKPAQPAPETRAKAPQEVQIAQPETVPAKAPQVAQTAPDVTTELAAVAPLPAEAPEVIAKDAAPAPKAAPPPINPAPATQAPAVLLSSSRGVEVLPTAPLAPGDVALDSINYDEAGEVLLSGRGDQTAFVRVYLDNAPVTTSRIRADGRWRVTLPAIDTGTYTLRVDQLDAAGEVIARVESPFLRESPEALAAAPVGGPITAITVQPGNTLWAIARNRYGEGMDYIKVFEANKDRIRDPDLIYPGQIFDLPSQ